jgi:hypothetical protein
VSREGKFKAVKPESSAMADAPSPTPLQISYRILDKTMV